MNKVILMGRLTRDAEIRYAQGDNSLAIARFSLAVDRRYSKNAEEQSTDFINCVAFGKIAEFLRDLAVKEQNLLLRAESRPAAIQTRTDRRYTPLTSWLRMQSLQSLNQPHQEMQADLHRQTDLHLARLLGMAS